MWAIQVKHYSWWVILLLGLCCLLPGCDRSENTPVKVSLSSSKQNESIQKEEEKPALRIAISGVISPKETFILYKDLLDYISLKLGLGVDLIQRQTYQEVNNLVRDNELDLAFVCSGAYVKGHDQFGMELLVAPVVHGETVYYSYIIVPKSSKVTNLEGLRGKRFAFSDPMSNTGKFSPAYMLATMHENADSFFRDYIYTYSHDRSIEMVAYALVDGAAVDSLIWEYMNSKDPTFTSQTRIIHKSEPYGIPPVVVPASLDKKLKDDLRSLFLNIHTEEKGRKILNSLFIDKFIVVDDRQYDSVRKMQALVDGK